MQPQGNEPSTMDKIRTQGNILSFIAGSLAIFSEVLFFRKHFGERYFNTLRTVAVFPIMLVYCVFWGGYDLRPILYCLLGYIVMSFIHQRNIARRRRRRINGLGGPVIHSYYNGVSRLARFFPKMDEVRIKAFAEPLCLLIAGFVCMIFSPPLGWLFIWTALAMVIHSGLLNARDENKVLDLTDAAMEGEMLAERFREVRGDVVRIHRRHS